MFPRMKVYDVRWHSDDYKGLRDVYPFNVDCSDPECPSAHQKLECPSAHQKFSATNENTVCITVNFDGAMTAAQDHILKEHEDEVLEFLAKVSMYVSVCRTQYSSLLYSVPELVSDGVFDDLKEALYYIRMIRNGHGTLPLDNDQFDCLFAEADRTGDWETDTQEATFELGY